jgi:isopenicillin-N N-acyltransferase like protein
MPNTKAQTLPVLDLGDDPHERGVAHGAALPQAIRDNIATYLARFEAGGLDAGTARREGEIWAEVIAGQNEDYAAEMRGVAKGAGLPIGDVAMLNARYEITFGLFGREAKAPDIVESDTSGCSTFGALASATASGHTILGQNWDWLAGVHGRCVVLRIRRTDKPSLICYTEAGIVGGKMGVNEHGIGLVENGLVSDHDGRNGYEKPFHLRCREILDAATFDHAMAPVLATKRVCSANFMIGQTWGDGSDGIGGEIIDLETSPNAVTYLYPQDGLLTHSNHFTDPRHGPSQMERLSASTLYRNTRLDRLLRQHIGRLDMPHFSAALADHFGHPNAICRHPDDRNPVAKQTMTNAAFVIDLDTRVMHIADGPPCTHRFIAHALDASADAQAAEAAE